MNPIQNPISFLENTYLNEGIQRDVHFHQAFLMYKDELQRAYTSGATIELINFCNDINEFLDKHLDALEVVTTYQKETEYLMGFKQALLMFQNEFEFILKLKDNEEI